ncbi:MULTISPECIES: amidohydrolase family protein [Paraburkholderia]|uniref:amidohydrolase family protein n=1 Tax=Paraburkholderia TaxID=1822464 RepID=UPI0038BDAFF0
MTQDIKAQKRVLTNVTLIDGLGNAPIANATVAVYGSRIVSVGTDVDIPDDAEVIDLKGMVVMPGLIDAHVHLGGCTHIEDFRKTILGGGTEPLFGGSDFTDNFRDARESSIRYGVTTIRSCGDYMHDMLKLRQDTADGIVTGPRIVACGPSFQEAGGHPNATVWGNDPVTLREAARLPKSPEEAREMVRELAGHGVDFIKVIINDSSISNRQVKFPRMPWAIISAIVEEAHAQKLIVAAHTENRHDTLRAVQIGIDDMEHLNLHSAHEEVDLESHDDLFRLLVEKETYVTPTMVVTAMHGKQASDVDIGSLRYGNLLFKRAYEAGVKLAVGTDAGAPEVVYGWAVHAELAMMVNEQGIPPIDAIKAATKTNSELLGLSQVIGTIEVGKQADLLVVSGNPVDDITHTKNVVLVMQGGKVLVDHRKAD